jgi:hypothetical protein
MTWNTTNGQSASDKRTYATCNGNKTDITGLSGLGLVEKLKSIARDNGVSKFDIYDSTNNSLSPADIESGNFTGDLNLVRFNAAA